MPERKGCNPFGWLFGGSEREEESSISEEDSQKYRQIFKEYIKRDAEYWRQKEKDN